jgi:hypothetical protein
MPLTEDEERAEHLSRMELMTTQIEQARINVDKMRLEMKMENRKFLVSALLAFAATLGAGVALGRFWLFHS